MFLKIPKHSEFAARRTRLYSAVLKKEAKKEETRWGRIVAEGALKMMLEGVSGFAVRPGDITISSSFSGKPFFSFNTSSTSGRQVPERFDFSVSHSDGVVGVSVSDRFAEGWVGFDIERIRKIPNEACEALLTDKEKKYLKRFAFSERMESEMLFWCIKESFLKAIGTGLRVHPKHVEIRQVGKKILISYRGEDQNARINWGKYNRSYIWSRVLIQSCLV